MGACDARVDWSVREMRGEAASVARMARAATTSAMQLGGAVIAVVLAVALGLGLASTAAAQSSGLPLYRLLGGKTRPSLRVYNTTTDYWAINEMKMAPGRLGDLIGRSTSISSRLEAMPRALQWVPRNFSELTEKSMHPAPVGSA